MITEPFEGARMEGVTGFFQGTSHKDGTEKGNEALRFNNLTFSSLNC